MLLAPAVVVGSLQQLLGQITPPLLVELELLELNLVELVLADHESVWLGQPA